MTRKACKLAYRFLVLYHASSIVVLIVFTVGALQVANVLGAFALAVYATFGALAGYFYLKSKAWSSTLFTVYYAVQIPVLKSYFFTYLIYSPAQLFLRVLRQV